MFERGDVVIKKKGGNKMIVYEITDSITCIWATDEVHFDKFDENDLMHLKDFESLMKQMDRDDKIQQIIN